MGYSHSKNPSSEFVGCIEIKILDSDWFSNLMQYSATRANFRPIILYEMLIDDIIWNAYRWYFWFQKAINRPCRMRRSRDIAFWLIQPFLCQIQPFTVYIFFVSGQKIVSIGLLNNLILLQGNAEKRNFHAVTCPTIKGVELVLFCVQCCVYRLSSPRCRSELIDSAWVVIVLGHKCIKKNKKNIYLQ